jgi:ABC-type molybdenum transport system ATPase subunit/photorepair protein PhrA
VAPKQAPKPTTPEITLPINQISKMEIKESAPETKIVDQKVTTWTSTQNQLEDDENMALHINIPKVLPPLGKFVTINYFIDICIATSEDVNIGGITITNRNVDLLVNATLRLNKGRRYGLIGKNGVGKVKYIP